MVFSVTAVRRLASRQFSTSTNGPRILLTGSGGQIGQELIPYLRKKYGDKNVIASDVKDIGDNGPFFYCDVLDKQRIHQLVVDNKVTWIVHLASLLSATGEKMPQLALNINAGGIQNVLEVAKQHNLRVFAPSTIAVFGPSTPKDMTPDETIMRPTTMYGVTKVHLELLGEYYHQKFGVDFRSLRYPGVISAEALPGGGTTDYAVEIFYEALKQNKYTSFLGPESALPMMYMPDCIKATHMLLSAPQEQLKQRVYNVTACSFTPAELAEQIKEFMPGFEISYKPDFRQSIADTWPKSISDERARADWGWKHDYDLRAMTKDMLTRLRQRLNL
eukprot:GILI01001112.1.p2 GENE.GILI01001112.1~~GILI01001112.1.p2  ORF type:complete len:350 (-),score=114.72 GILI01001112.1:420-1415(-)